MASNRRRASKRNFDRTANFYEKLAGIYSTGQIQAAKASQIAEIEPGDRVLYVGVGAGEDAALAVRKGARVTCIDLSNEMLRRADARLLVKGLEAEMIHGDVWDHDRREHYDVVAANFFFNCFREPEMARMLRHVATFVRPQGKLLIADVAVPQGNLLHRGFQQVYNAVGLVTYWAMGLAPLHPIYDYCRYLEQCGLAATEVRDFRLGKIGPVVFQSITAVRTAPATPAGVERRGESKASVRPPAAREPVAT